MRLTSTRSCARTFSRNVKSIVTLLRTVTTSSRAMVHMERVGCLSTHFLGEELVDRGDTTPPEATLAQMRSARFILRLSAGRLATAAFFLASPRYGQDNRQAGPLFPTPGYALARKPPPHARLSPILRRADATRQDRGPRQPADRRKSAAAS